MRRSARFVLAAISLAVSADALAQDKAPASALAARPQGVYATIDMGPAQDMARRLSAGSGTDREFAIKEVRDNAAAFPPSVLYVLASTLAEDRAEEAVFWYHVGRLRATYDVLRCRDESARMAAILELRKLLNERLRAVMFYRRDRLVRLARMAIDWDTKHPRNYDQRWPALYGRVAASSAGDDAALMLPEGEWPAILEHVHDAHLKSVRDFAAQKQ